jgi:hypothetical protein
MNPTHTLQSLRQFVRRHNRRWRNLVIAEAVSFSAATLLAALWLVFLLDNALHFTMSLRLIVCGFFGVGLLFGVIRVVNRWRRSRFGEDQVALAIERGTQNHLENRLINSLQLSRTKDPDAMTTAVIEDNCRQLTALRLPPAMSGRPALIAAGLALAMALAGIGFWWIARDRFVNAATRIFMPLADVAPLYRTRILLTPGDVEVRPGSDVLLTAQIEGRVPELITLFRHGAEARFSEDLPVPPGTNRITYLLRNVQVSMTYAVRGGDYITPFYAITIPQPADLQRLTATYAYPPYTRRPDKIQEGSQGELEALRGTRVSGIWGLNRPVEDAVLVLEGTTDPAADSNATQRIALTRMDAQTYRGEFEIGRFAGYRVESRQTGRSAELGRRYEIRIFEDQPPELEFAGIEPQAELMIDAIIPVTLVGRDDFGLRTVGLFFRSEDEGGTNPVVGSSETQTWQTLRQWDPPGTPAVFATNTALALAALAVAEGERGEVAILGRDTCPSRADQWVTGRTCAVVMGGVGTALQLQYEKILRDETALARLTAEAQGLITRQNEWTVKLDPASGLRWDARENLEPFVKSIQALALDTDGLRSRTAALARGLDEEAAAVRLSLGLLADTELVRLRRIFQSVAGRDSVQGKRAALGEARLTLERMVRSLKENQAQHARYRRDWELAHMTAFLKMLAERQDRMATESATYSGLEAGSIDPRVATGTGRRQDKVDELLGLAGTAMKGLGSGEIPPAGPVLGAAFIATSVALEAPGVRPALREAAGHLRAARWTEATGIQRRCADTLMALYVGLVKVQSDAARQALEDVKKLTETGLEGQKAIEELKAGSSENLLELNPEQLSVTEIVHLQQMAARERQRQAAATDQRNDYLFEEKMKAMLSPPDSGRRQAFEDLKLAQKPSGQMSFPKSSDRAGNTVTPHIQEEFEDLVGDLLEEADDLKKDYETYNINAGFNISESGEIGKQGGDLNSTAAAAATGNMKPPSQDVGGISRIGRQGARSHGLVAGDESTDRRGRDEAQESQQEIPDQPGKLSEKQSDDPQKDSSTGVGGKEVASDDASFSVKDAGEWKDEMTDRMKPPNAVNKVVERQGKPLPPDVADKLRDWESRQEQIIQRLKVIRKKLDNLYLPTEDLDALANQLNANLDRLKENPSADVFRLQQQTLERLVGTLMVFNRAAAEFAPSVPRDQRLRGSILDEMSAPSLPGYEEAVKRYYEELVR